MLNAPPSDLESQKRSLLCSKHSAWLMDPNNQHSVQWLLNVLWKQGLVMHALPQTCLCLTGLLRHEHTDWLPGMWQRLKKLCLIHQSLISEPQIRQTNMILNVRIVYWIRIRSSQWLTSRIHGHHHILCFLPKAALLGLCCRRIQSLHVWVFLCSVLYLITEMHALLGWNQVTDFAAEKVLISLHRDTRHLFFCCMLWVIIDLHSEVQSHQFCSICLSRVFSPVHFTIHRASPINSHIINKHIFIGSGLCRCYFFFSFLFFQFQVHARGLIGILCIKTCNSMELTQCFN